MGRKKSRPIRSGGILPDIISSNINNREQSLENDGQFETVDLENVNGTLLRRQFFVDIDGSHWASDEHLDIAEIVLEDIKFSSGVTDQILIEDQCLLSNISMRFRLSDVEYECFRLGQWPDISVGNISLELVDLESHNPEDKNNPMVLFSGVFDGPHESVSGLVHLLSMKVLTLRPISQIRILRNVPSLRLRVEILRSAFDACESLLEVGRQPWRKSMIKVMSWLRPEVSTSETKYGISELNFDKGSMQPDSTDDMVSRMHSDFDAARFYEAIKPSKHAPMLEDELPDLVPHLRPYQKRAAYWMVHREREISDSSDEMMKSQLFAPLCVPVIFLEGNSSMFYNPFGGNVSLHSESISYVSGGILADEMGLGKTVELLTCILAHRKSYSDDCIISENEFREGGSLTKRLKQERVECICGAVTENTRYKGLWVQCDICDAWQHADCVGFSPKEKPSRSHEDSRSRPRKEHSSKTSHIANQKDSTRIINTNENYTCSVCSELIEAANSTIVTGATLIVCPSPILAQWHSELIRHTKPGSLKIHIYDGARKLSPLTNLRTDMSELASSDIVLTTYDVLKEDLSHDSDRHDGDRRCMRFEKRYPVVPTLLTRIFWWRLCLDEAQMVEGNAAAVTEMALRLRAQHRWCITGTPIQRRLDDLYGLLRFLRASPFDVYRWWVEVIRDPYERKDSVAMEFAHKLFKQIMWRSSKVHVSEELQLPPQEESLSWLIFSPIEEHFYQKQHETCMSFAHEAIQRFKNDISKKKFVADYNASHDAFLSHADAAKLLSPLLKLRQACCHPQVGSSGLRSLQQSPMTMDEILEVLISKAKIEGEESLRKVIVALNGLAALALIEQDYKQASSLYREALSIAEENSEDFRLDPLLSLHVHHNLADLIALTSEFSPCSVMVGSEHEICETKTGKLYGECYSRKRKLNKDTDLDLPSDIRSLKNPKTLCSSDLFTIDLNGGKIIDCDAKFEASFRLFDDGYLRKTCESIKQKYLSAFISKLTSTQQEFVSIHTQVCEMSKVFQDHNVNWWLEALNLIEQSKDSSDELMKKIDEAVSRAVNGTGSSKVSSRYRTLSGLMLSIQSGLDSLETSRQALIKRLIEIDRTMERPREADILRVRFCPNCQSGDGPLCVHCELDGLFQEYEARLFHLKKGNYMMASAEEAINLQKKKNELNLFFRDSRNFAESSAGDAENKGQRHVSTNVVDLRGSLLSSGSLSVEDFSMSGSETGKARVGNWTHLQDVTLIDLLLEHLVKTGVKPGTQKSTVFTDILRPFNQTTGVCFTKENLINRWRNLRKEYMLYNDLCNRSGWGWDDSSKLPVPSGVNGWDEIIAIRPEYRRIRDKPYTLMQQMTELCGSTTATGTYSFGSSQAVPPRQPGHRYRDDLCSGSHQPASTPSPHSRGITPEDAYEATLPSRWSTSRLSDASHYQDEVYRSPSDLEAILGVIKRYSKSLLGRQSMISARKHLLNFEAMRKEFAHARSLSIAQARVLSAHDEIKMSTSRLRLRDTEDEPTAINVLSSDQLIPNNMQFSSDKLLSLSSLARIKGQLRYLKGLMVSKHGQQECTKMLPKLQDSQDPSSSTAYPPYELENPSKADDHLCPICHEKLGNQKMVFQCGHVTCCKCCLEMTDHAVLRLGKYHQKWVMCPTCRQHTDFGNIAYVDDKQNEVCDLKVIESFQGENLAEISLKVEGSYGTKIEAVTRRILWIHSTDQDAKVLVFSSWNDVLNLLEHALRDNNISYIRMKGGRKSQAAISQFKGQDNIGEENGKSHGMITKSNSVQVLLLLIQHGANGLNILEAQHVILVEPLLNPAAEAQAINRVHRIGQEKKTFVHRFIVETTVERSIYNLNRCRNVNSVIGAKSKHQDQPALTLKDIESLVQPTLAKKDPAKCDLPVEGSLRHLPPAVAAGLAAERRLTEASPQL